MSNLLQQYYQGITQQLRSEVDFINSLFEHQGFKGEGNEVALRDLISRFIPKRFGIGTGVVIDRHGSPSRQCDIVIYDTFLYPSLLALTSIHLFPVDLVYAVIEVKTTLTAQTSKDAITNISSVRSLDYIKARFGSQRMIGDTYAVEMQETTPPIGAVFAYNSEVEQKQTFKNWFTPDTDDKIHLYPSVIGCLDFGIITFSPVIQKDGAVVVYLHPEIGSKPECRTFPITRIKENVNEARSIDDIEYAKLPSMPPNNQKYVLNGVSYPVKKAGEEIYPIDQSRVLLNFLMQFNDMLTVKKIHPELSIYDSYLRDIDRFQFSS